MPKKINFQLTGVGLREAAKAIQYDKRPEVRQRWGYDGCTKAPAIVRKTNFVIY